MLFVGTYTRNTDSDGIYVFDDNLELIQINGDIDNPSYLLMHPDSRYLYAVNEINDFRGQRTGALSSFEIGDEGKLDLINQVDSRGSDPCHLSMNKDGSLILVSNYSGGSFASFPLGNNGALGANRNLVKHSGASRDKVRQASAHVHSSTLLKDDLGLYIADLGLDKMFRYTLEANGRLSEEDVVSIQIKAGAGPRHFTFDKHEQFGFLINELDNTVISFERSAVTNDITELSTVSTLPADYSGKSYAADIHLSVDGRFLYASNRGHDSIAVFKIQENADLELIQIEPCRGKHPRNFILSADSAQLLVANKDSNNIVIFDLDTDSGKLAYSGKQLLEVPSPVCLVLA